MPVKVKCPNCGKSLSAPDAARGKAIKCPECQTKIAVPAEESSAKPASKPAASSKSKVKKPSKPLDSEAALAKFDMRRAEDTEARICSKCGFDMQYQDEEDTECPQCGYDSEAHGLGAKARKKALRGPDPDDFYPGLFKQSWKFVGRNIFLAWRTVAYTLIALLIAMLCAFLYLYISMWPPRYFIALCFFISFLVIPGWMWFLDTEVIKLTLERKDKFKKLNFDFFLASAMGAAFVFWCVAVALPVVILPAGLGYFLVTYNGMPDYVMTICIIIGVIPAIWMLPVVMSHMAMPVQYKGWLIWKVIPMWARNIKPLSVWFMWFLLTNVLTIAGITVIATVYAADIGTIVETMESNADIARKKFSQVQNPNAKRKGDAPVAPVVIGEPQDVNFIPLIVPGVILVVMTIANGFTCMFNMRTNGQFTYYHKNSLEMIDKLKEYKYVAREKRDEDEDEKPKTTSQLIVDAIALVMIFDVIGLVFGMLLGSLTSFGMMPCLILGAAIGNSLAGMVIGIQCLIMAFSHSLKWGFISLIPFGFVVFVFQDFEERKGMFFKWLFVVVMGTTIRIAVEVNNAMYPGDQSAPPAAQAPDAGQMMPGQPAPGVPPGAPGQTTPVPPPGVPGQPAPAAPPAP